MEIPLISVIAWTAGTFLLGGAPWVWIKRPASKQAVSGRWFVTREELGIGKQTVAQIFWGESGYFADVTGGEIVSGFKTPDEAKRSCEERLRETLKANLDVLNREAA